MGQDHGLSWERRQGIGEGSRLGRSGSNETKIFEGFVHYANPDYKPKSGRGLGLSISRDLAERYGGSLDIVGTEPGKGSIFVLRLPAAS